VTDKGYVPAYELTAQDKEILKDNSREIAKALSAMVLNVAAHIGTGCRAWYCHPAQVIDYMDSLNETQVRQLLSMAVRTLAQLHTDDNR